MLKIFKNSKLDYLANIEDPLNKKINFHYPDGFDLEIFTLNCFARANSLIKSQFDKEHVTTFIRNSNLFKKIY